MGAMLAALIWSAFEAAPPEQIAAAWRGSEAAMLAAKHAPIGAKICTIRAIRTIGKNFRNRRRIGTSTSSTSPPIIAGTGFRERTCSGETAS